MFGPVLRVTLLHLCSRIQSCEEVLKSRGRELKLKVQLAEDQARMNEHEVEEYANLVHIHSPSL
jgi:hypothetical protein